MHLYVVVSETLCTNDYQTSIQLLSIFLRVHVARNGVYQI